MPQYDIGLTSDTLVFKEKNNILNLLLIKRGNEPSKGKWALPGGFVEENEETVDGAVRELKEETNITAPWLMEVGTFSTVGRDPRMRTITLAYLTFLDTEDVEATAGDDAKEAQFFPLDSLPELAFDHSEVLDMAMDRLIEALSTPDGLALLFPSRYTLEDMNHRASLIHPDMEGFIERLNDLNALDEDDKQPPTYALDLEKLRLAYGDRLLPF